MNVALEPAGGNARETLRKILRGAITQNGGTQTEIAWGAGIRADNLSHILCGDIAFSLETFDKIMKVCNAELLATWRTKEPE